MKAIIVIAFIIVCILCIALAVIFSTIQDDEEATCDGVEKEWWHAN